MTAGFSRMYVCHPICSSRADVLCNITSGPVTTPPGLILNDPTQFEGRSIHHMDLI